MLIIEKNNSQKMKCRSIFIVEYEKKNLNLRPHVAVHSFFLVLLFHSDS